MDAPSITLTTEYGMESRKTVKFQCGLVRETETFVGEEVELLCRETLLDYVCDMLNTKYPEHPYGNLAEKVILYKHGSRDSLAPLGDTEAIEDGSIIEIVLSATAKQEYDDTICPHILKVHTYKGAAAFCDYCGVILFGLLKQGLKCDGCEKNFHKKCAYKIPNNCTRLGGGGGGGGGGGSNTGSSGSYSTTSGTFEGVLTSPVLARTPKETWSGRPLWIDRALMSRTQVPHTLFVNSLKKPTACHHCKKLIKGVFRNGMKCKDCKMNFHKRCAREVGNNCLGEVPSLSRVDSGEWSQAARHVIANEFYLSEENMVDVRELEDLREESPTLSSMSSQDDLKSMQSQNNALNSPAAVPTTPTTTAANNTQQQQQQQQQPFTAAPMDNAQPPAAGGGTSSMDAIAEEPSGEDTTSNEGSEHNQKDLADNIKLQRVTGVSMRYTKPVPASVVMEGWMVHYTDRNSMRKKHYWRLDTKALTLYNSDVTNHYFKEIQLADILAVDPMATPDIYPQPPHVFEIVTSTQTYYVGIDMTGVLPRDLAPLEGEPDMSQLTIAQLEDMGIGLNMGIMWEEALHGALMPITPQASMGSLADIGMVSGIPVRPQSFRGKPGSMRGSLKGSFRGAANRGTGSFRGPSRAHSGSRRGSFRVPKQGGAQSRGTGGVGISTKPKVVTNMDISLFYQIFPDEVLGSGQFGTVYSSKNRQTGGEMAVKVVDKMRFPNKHDAQLRQEVTILQQLSHPGIIHLEQMFETPEKIYVVMEKMSGDMLEMILNSPESKLSERMTKFMIYQILMALQYLHKRDIVHCDLKPENVLLTSDLGMPQTKLCDFGFSRIIGEKSFRKSIVGTPAYLAPEVLRNEGYNKSLDLWSVGVIVYVSLSGTFPFNEDEDIEDQIHNAAFMFPPDPWANISPEAIDIITKMLQVDRRTRYNVSKGLAHKWLVDMQLWEDLCQFEGKFGSRYLTHESEDQFWRKKGAKPHPLRKKEEKELNRSRAEKQSASPLMQARCATTPRQQQQQSQSQSQGSPPPLLIPNGNAPVVPSVLDGSAGGHGSTATLPSPTAVSPKSPKETVEEGEQREPGEGGDDKGTAHLDRNQFNVVNLPDPVIVKREEHAKRVGYQVTTL